MIILAVIAGIAFAAGMKSRPSERFFSSGPTIDTLERLNELVTLRTQISDVLTCESNNYLGSWLIKGDALISIDLNKAEIPNADKDLTTRHAKIVLPAPHVLQARVDHEKSMTWDVKHTTWMPWGGDQDKMRDDAMKQAQKLIEHAAESEECLGKARDNAKLAIQNLYTPSTGKSTWSGRIIDAAPPCSMTSRSVEVEGKVIRCNVGEGLEGVEIAPFGLTPALAHWQRRVGAARPRGRQSILSASATHLQDALSASQR